MAEEHELAAYRELIVGAHQKAQDDYDKTVLLLAGGALGVSFSFFDSVLKDRAPVCVGVLLAAWISWGSSLLCVLASYLFSIQALLRTIRQIDQLKIRSQRPGGFLAGLTSALNWAGGLFLVSGVVCYALFAFTNLSAAQKDKVHGQAKGSAIDGK